MIVHISWLKTVLCFFYLELSVIILCQWLIFCICMVGVTYLHIQCAKKKKSILTPTWMWITRDHLHVHNFLSYKYELMGNTWRQHRYRWLHFPSSIPTRHGAFWRLKHCVVCERGKRTSDRMTIRNTLRDHGQRYRPRMACLKKVGCPYTRLDDHSLAQACRLYLQTHL